jgi:hypothetical protein
MKIKATFKSIKFEYDGPLPETVKDLLEKLSATIQKPIIKESPKGDK